MRRSAHLPLHSCTHALRNCSVREVDFDWADVRVFLALSQQGHMADAARALSVNTTTVLRRVAALERALGCALFHRGKAGWGLTPAGLRLLPMARAMETNAASLQRAAATETTRLSGVVRLSVPELFSSEFLVPLLPQVRARFPEVAIELTATNRLANLSRREADLALRLNRPEEPALLARRLAKVHSALAAAPSYLGARGTPTRDSLSTHDLVWDTVALDGDSIESNWRAKYAQTAKVVFRSESPHARCAAAEAGLGITFLPRYVVNARPRLERIDGLPVLPLRELWLVVHRESKRQLPVRAIANALGELVVGHRAQLGD